MQRKLRHGARLALICTLFAVATARANDFATQAMDATFKLYNAGSTATCFLLRRGADDPALYVVTAAHALERAKGESAIIVLRAPKPDSSVERRDHTIQIRHGDKPLWTRHEKQDLAVLRLTEPFPIAMHPLESDVIADAKKLSDAGAHICSPLFVLTYPTRFEAHRAGYPVARQGIFATPPLLPIAIYPTFLADFTTFPGDSGGPVFLPDQNGHLLLAGIVLAQFRHDETVKSEYSETTLHHPLGLGTILHAQFIREVLDTFTPHETRPEEPKVE